MNVLYLLKVGTMLCMTVQPQANQVPKALVLYQVDLLSAEASSLEVDSMFSGMQPYNVNFINKVGVAGCFTKDIFPK